VIFINEWLPNPVGADAAGEFVELYNNGDTSVSLSGWVLKTENGKKFSLAGRSVAAHGYLVLKRSATKLALRNTDGGLSLYDPRGALVDGGNFLGSAPEGKSFSRADYGASPAQHFAFADPTPGAPNKAAPALVAKHAYPLNAPLSRQLESFGFFGIMMGTAILLLGLIIYVIKAHEELSELFFQRDEEIRRDAW
jgi:hypothetical protein